MDSGATLLSLLSNQIYIHFYIIFNLHHAQKLQLQKKVIVFESPAKSNVLLSDNIRQIASLFHNYAT
jgi:hypothetical protein